jgi:hypothetical protein
MYEYFIQKKGQRNDKLYEFAFKTICESFPDIPDSNTPTGGMPFAASAQQPCQYGKRRQQQQMLLRASKVSKPENEQGRYVFYKGKIDGLIDQFPRRVVNPMISVIADGKNMDSP